ncbi:uncharacterized protein LOC100280252 [Zea mays]|uniref:uncharacterized protein LOC100280252 n=1 Tax=Zea mays TaxID=4577 RepID=UPI0004DE9F3E|nr:uncharacterized protein LOC100280252 [Zea mays]
MTGTTWIIDSQRFATKIKNASGSLDPSKQKWIGNPSKECPKCSHVIDNSDVVHQWPGLPKGVKFDPSDQELIWHLMAKHGKSGIKPHPFIDEFIPTVEEDEGICYTHPQKLPGVKQNGSVSHFFHRTFKAYNTGTRKRRRINTDDADVRWHKTGKTKPVLVDGKHLGCKKIMVLYISPLKGGKAEKTNWVIHQYHLGTGEDERDGEYVVSKLFFQQQFKPGDKNAQELTTSDDLESMAAESNLPDFTTLPTDKHVGTVQEVVHNPEHNLYQVVHQWPGLPKGVKFDPSDQELIWHLMAKHGKSGIKPHPFIDEFIPTVEEDEGICYTHPQKLPGVKQNGSVSHFFHRTFKAYNTGTRKRRRINTDDADVRWHKTGKTKPVLVDGKHLGCKKIMVLYISPLKGGKAEKTNWVIHQYHLGAGEDERDGEYVVSKLFFQQQFKPGDKNAQELTTSDDLESMAAESNLPDFTTLPTDKHVGTVQEVVHNPEHNLYQVVHQWPGLPKGVKFDPSDQELIWHLMAKHGKSGIKPHPFIDEFIPTVEEDEGICYTHPQKLPGVKQNGSVSHFFHRTFKAYNTGTRKRRRINTDDADVRWHKTGKTKPVLVDGKHLGCKKIMVLYISPLKGGKAEKTNWVIHQYHLGTGEDERDGEYVVSKLFFQQQFKPGDKNAQELTTSDDLESMAAESNLPDFTTLPTDKHVGTVQEVVHNPEHNLYQLNRNCEISIEETVVLPPSVKTTKDGDNLQSQDQKLWEGDSQFELLDSQQLAEGLALCDEFLLSQSQTSCGGGDEPRETKPCLAAYAHLSAEDFKKDLECQRLEPTDNTNLELDNTDEFRLSQIEFSQDSFMTWAAEKITDD